MLLFNCVFVAYVNTLCDFNISNVTIQQSSLIGDFDRMDISIHLMLLFNSDAIALSKIQHHFNTSNVTIQHVW